MDSEEAAGAVRSSGTRVTVLRIDTPETVWAIAGFVGMVAVAFLALHLPGVSVLIILFGFPSVFVFWIFRYQTASPRRIEVDGSSITLQTPHGLRHAFLLNEYQVRLDSLGPFGGRLILWKRSRPHAVRVYSLNRGQTLFIASESGIQLRGQSRRSAAP